MLIYLQVWYELPQFKKDGCLKYFSLDNINDFLLVIINFAICFLRHQLYNAYLAAAEPKPSGPSELDASTDIAVRVLQFIAILQSIPKLGYYARTYDAYVNIVELLRRTMIEVLIFLSVFGFCCYLRRNPTKENIGECQNLP